MRQIVVPFVAALLGSAVGAVASARWLVPSRSASDAPAADSAATDDLREQLREVKALLDRPRELSAPVPNAANRAGAAPDADRAAAGRPSAELEAAIAKAVTAGIEAARKQDASLLAALKPEPKRKVTLAEAARELALSSAQEDEIRRAYTESTDRFLKLVAEPDSTPDAVRRELEEAKGDVAKRTGLMVKYMPKMLGKIGDFMSIQMERDARIHKALGRENVPKYEKLSVLEEDPFGMDGADFSISAGSEDK